MADALPIEAASVAVIAYLALLGYCLTTGWTVLGRLGAVRLAGCRKVLDVVSVRDAVLCFLGYRVALELPGAATRRPPA